jgi:PAS domain S-box-containing protein
MSEPGSVLLDQPGAGWIGTVLESAPDGLVVVRSDGRIALVNARVEEIFGYDRAELVGQPVETLVPDAARAAHVAHRAGYAAHPWARPMGSDLDLKGRRQDGTEVPLDISLSPVAGGDEVVVILRDATDRRRAEVQAGYLAALIESSHDAVYSEDGAGNVTSWNRGAHLLLGHDSADIVGRPAVDLVARHHRDEYCRVLHRVRAGETVRHFDADLRRRDGLVFPAWLTMSPIRDPHNAVLGVSVIARDVTEERLTGQTLADSEKRLREGEALAHVGGWVVDAASGTVQWSEELYRIHGVEPAAFDGTIGAHVDCAHGDDRPALEAAIASALAARQPFELEYRIVPREGVSRWLYTKAEPAIDDDGTVIGLRGICQDVTERHVTEAAVRAAYEREREAADALRAADTMKDEFLATVSHELRTPLTAILGFSALMKGATKSLATDDLAQRIERNGREMLAMVERILDFSRLQAGKVTVRPEPVALDALLWSSVAGVIDSLGGREVVVDGGTGVMVAADRAAMGHVLGNLLANAATFSPPESAIRVEASLRGGEAMVSVTDGGRGIPPALLERIFERFYQAPDHPTGKRGAGVGLAIVRRYVELQGGRIWAESEAGAGATFRLTIPLAEESR